MIYFLALIVSEATHLVVDRRRNVSQHLIRVSSSR